MIQIETQLELNYFYTDIVLYNYADTRLEEKREVLVIVSSDGTVKWRPPSIFKSTCQINIEKFPYDHQNCSMKFGNELFLPHPKRQYLCQYFIYILKEVGPMPVIL